MNMDFLGIAMNGKSIVLAILAGVTHIYPNASSTSLPKKIQTKQAFTASDLSIMNIREVHITFDYHLH